MQRFKWIYHNYEELSDLVHFALRQYDDALRCGQRWARCAGHVVCWCTTARARLCKSCCVPLAGRALPSPGSRRPGQVGAA